MIKSDKRIKISLLIFYVVVVLFFFVISFYYSNYTYQKIQIDFANQNTLQVEKQISNSLNNDYNLILSYLNENKDPNELILSSSSSILEVYNLDNGSININGNSYKLKNKNNLTNYQFIELNEILENEETGSLFNSYYLSFYLKDYEKIILVNSDSYIKGSLSSYEGNINDLVILNKSGLFQYVSSGIYSINLLTNYVNRPDDIYIKDNIIDKGLTGGLNTKVNGKKQFVSFSPLNNEQYLMVVYNELAIVSGTKMFLNIFLVSFGGALILLLIINRFIYYILDRKYDDLELNKINFYYNKPPIIYVDKKGKIKGVNKTFKKFSSNYKDYKDVNSLFIDDKDLIMLSIKKQDIINANLENDNEVTNVSFIPIKARGGYSLIGIMDQHLISIEKSYKTMALFNDITNLPNINAFYERTNSIINNIYESPNKHTFLFINIVDFRNVNKLIGESSANILIDYISTLLKREVDLNKAKIYHTKIDNFIIIFDEKKKESDLENFTNSFIREFNKQLSKVFQISITFKFSVYNTSVETKDIDPKELYKILVDTADYAKGFTRRNMVVYDTTMKSYFNNLKTMEEDLINAIDKDEFEMYMQAQYNNLTNKIVGFETLIRWNNPKYFHESPEKFILLAEASNLIEDIGMITIRKSMEIASIMSKYNIKVGVNLSPVQLLQVGFVESFINMFKKYNIKKGMFSVEITENVLVTSFNLVNEKLRQLKEQGVNVHLDDFGTGYSSLKYLDQLHIDTIKIDREFIINFPKDDFSRETVTFITKLANNLNLKVIVEGVETEEQNKYLKKIGANIIQGFLISRPVNLNDAIKLVEKYNINSEVDKDEN